MSDSGKPLEGLHLLVIEDEQDTRELITFILQLWGAEVTAVIHIYEAIEALDRFIPDVILSNTHLPDGDGYMLIGLWRDKEVELGIEPIPAIIIADSDREVSRNRIHQAGFQTYVSKPLDVTVIVETVATVASRQGAKEREH
ncbi:response regulator [Leptolyngbya sp. FACHB-711]|uniref:response regulator n=1 Tax=unclassified Leptolyngbya TaxID=2650499 RepID=UPI0016865FAC|nr:response regulator [Leptolyngbya sp. FACHB-711]MBD1853451.1 response regulator [Cyanobacteria bacterium FACHB-502]MBD2024768.1 response regulator [Leptolyngbya sp. FACHB-711]